MDCTGPEALKSRKRRQDVCPCIGKFGKPPGENCLRAGPSKQDGMGGDL